MRLHRQAKRETLAEPRLRLDDGLIARGQLVLKLAATPVDLCALLHHAADAHGHRALGRAARFHLHVQVTGCHLFVLGVRAGPSERRAPLFSLAAEGLLG